MRRRWRERVAGGGRPRNRIEAAPAKGVTAQQPPKRESAAIEHPVAGHGYHSVFRTGRLKAAPETPLTECNSGEIQRR